MTLRLNGATSGYVEIDAPAVAGTTALTLPATSGTVALTASPTFTGNVALPSTTTLGGSTLDLPGLIKIFDTSFSGSSSIAVNNVFSSTYKNYRMIMSRFVASSAGQFQVRCRFRSGGSSDSGATNYRHAMWRIYGNALTADTGNAGGSFINLAWASTGAEGGFSGDILSPFEAQTTQMFIDSYTYQSDIASVIANKTHGYNATATQFDGIEIFPESGTFTGVLRIYGYRD